MKPQFVYLAAFAASALSMSAAYGACSQDATQAAEYFYHNHANFYFEDLPSARSLVAPRLLSALKREYTCPELCAIEAVPWLDAQDGEVAEPIAFDTVETGPTRALIVMEYFYHLGPGSSFNRKQKVYLEFERKDAGQCWLLSDLVSPSGISLVNMLEAWHYQNGTP